MNKEIEDLVEELQGKIGLILAKAIKQNWKNGGVLEYEIVDLVAESDENIRTTLTSLLEKERARIAGEVEKDKERLDFLDECNHRLNEYHGTNYGWELILNHNVTRLLSGNLNRIDLNDANGSKDKSKSCREAIDKALSIVRNNQ